MKTKLALITFAQLLSLTAFAGGSIATSDVLDKISDPSLKQTVNAHFDLQSDSDGMRIGACIGSETLSGARIGPYTTCAKAKGTTGKYTFSLYFVTDTRFLDKSGNEVPLGPDAYSIKEEVINVQVAPLADFCN